MPALPIDPAEALGAVTGSLKVPLKVPLRLLDEVTTPFRLDIARDMRRSLGVPERPVRPSIDPAEAFLRPGSIARRVHSDLSSMVIGGLAALFLQMLHPLAMAGVADHSNYRDDPIGRLRRTANFVGFTTFGSVDEAHAAIEQVKTVHHHVRGTAPDGRPYSASDPELVTWVHVAEVWCFLESARRFGDVRLGPGDADRYFAETAEVAYELGAEWVPRSEEEVDAYFKRIRPELYAGAQAKAARNWLIRGVARSPEDRLVYGVLVSGAVGLLPGWARRELGLPRVPLADRLVVTPVARLLCASIRWAVAPLRADQPQPESDEEAVRGNGTQPAEASG